MRWPPTERHDHGCAARVIRGRCHRTQEPGARRRLRRHAGGQRGAARRRHRAVPGRRRPRSNRTLYRDLRRSARRPDRSGRRRRPNRWATAADASARDRAHRRAQQSALCAEAVGAMEEALRLTTEYLKTRKQFGVTLSKFQTLTQRAADMYVSLELARSMSLYAAMSIADGNFDPVDRGAGQAADRPVRPAHRPGGDPAARRHRHDRRVPGRPLRGPADRDRAHLGSAGTSCTC